MDKRIFAYVWFIQCELASSESKSIQSNKILRFIANGPQWIRFILFKRHNSTHFSIQFYWRHNKEMIYLFAHDFIFLLLSSVLLRTVGCGLTIRLRFTFSRLIFICFLSPIFASANRKIELYSFPPRMRIVRRSSSDSNILAINYRTISLGFPWLWITLKNGQYIQWFPEIIREHGIWPHFPYSTITCNMVLKRVKGMQKRFWKLTLLTMFGHLLPSNTVEVYNSISVNQSTTDDEVWRDNKDSDMKIN